MNDIRVLIADDHAVVRMGLAALLNAEKDMTVVGQSANGDQAVKDADRLAPDVIVMDLMMPKKDGVMATDEIHRAHPEIKIIILTTFGTSDGIARALEVGATGALLKTSEGPELVRTIRQVASGRQVISEDVQKLLADDPPARELTPRQHDILSAMARGLSNREIARQFGIRMDGVTRHVIAILAKLNAANRTEAVAIAMRKQLLKI